jgi:UDP-glucose 4-epimerase
VSVAELARLMMQATGVTVPLEHAPARPGDVRRSLGDPTRAAAELGFTAEVVIEDGLRRLLGPTQP